MLFLINKNEKCKIQYNTVASHSREFIQIKTSSHGACCDIADVSKMLDQPGMSYLGNSDRILLNFTGKVFLDLNVQLVEDKLS